MSGADEIDPDVKLPVAIGGSESATAIAPAEGVEGADAASEIAASAIADNRAIAEALASGALDPVAAQQLLIDQAVAELPSNVAPEQLERLRVELATLLDGDPTLAALLRP